MKEMKKREINRKSVHLIAPLKRGFWFKSFFFYYKKLRILRFPLVASNIYLYSYEIV